MKKYSLVLSIIIAITSTSCVTLPKEETRFEQAVKSAFEKQDISQLDKLTCWDRVPEARRKAGTSLCSVQGISNDEGKKLITIIRISKRKYIITVVYRIPSE